MPTTILTNETHVIEIYKVPGNYYYRVFDVTNHGLIFDREFYLSDLSINKAKELIAG